MVSRHRYPTDGQQEHTEYLRIFPVVSEAFPSLLERFEVGKNDFVQQDSLSQFRNGR